MNKTILILLSIVWLGLGCGTVKTWLGVDEKPHEEFRPPPSPDEVEYDENGNPIFTDEHLTGNKKPFNWTMAFLMGGFLTTTAFIARGVIKRRNEKR
jgi:hypothetical protein